MSESISEQAGNDQAAVHSNQQLKIIVEGALFVADVPLTIDRMMGLFPGDARPTREELRAVLDELEQDYAGRGVEIKKVDNAYRFQSRESLAPWLQKLWATRAPRYSRALLETLAIIAYRQPITRGEIEEIRGVSVNSEIIKTLLGRDWVRIVGHRDIPGKPELLGTTRGFLEHFNLKGLSELPPLAELRDTEVIAREMNLPLPLDEPGAEWVADDREVPQQADAGEDVSDAQAEAGDAPPGDEPNEAAARADGGQSTAGVE